MAPISGGEDFYGTMYYGLKGQDGYENAITELDNISKLYGQGYGATGARSIKVEDINKVTGYNPDNVGKYDPDQTGDGMKFEEGSLNEYGNKVTYYWDGTDKPYYIATDTLRGNLSYSHSTNGFNWYENGWKISPKSATATTSAMEKITTIKSNYYRYYPQTLTNSYDENATEGLSTGSKAYKALFTDASGNENYEYWLGSYYIEATTSYTHIGLYRVGDFCINYYGNCLCDSSNMEHYSGRYMVRPVISLKSDINLTGNSEDGWKIVRD